MRRAILLAALLGVIRPALGADTPPGSPEDLATPDRAFKLAALDLVERVPPEKRRVTRYLSLQAVPSAEREAFTRSITFTLNSVSWRTQLVRPPRIADGLLLRLDLESIGWDRESRAARLKRFEDAGAKFAEDQKARVVDIWETLVADEPYFQVTQEYQGKVVRGWVDPRIEESARSLSYSSKFIARADWLLPRLLVERKQGGFYSDVLLFPPNESDLYKIFGVDAKRVDAEAQLKQGGAMVESIVALHNREVQVIPSLFGLDDRYIWRTFDFNKDDVGDKSVLEAFAGTAKHDGREIIGTLPNGLHWYYLSDGAGNQAAVVPQDIAVDMRNGALDAIRDRNVVNAYKCISCHGPLNGIYPFDDVVSKAITDPSIGLAVVSTDKRRVAERKEAIEEYYLSPLAARVKSQQQSYAARVKACNDLESGPNSVAVVAAFDRYFWSPVDPAQAALEMGYDATAAKAIWRASGNPQLIVLSSGQPIRRAAWEKSFPDAMKAVTWPWERPVEILKAKKAHPR